VYTFTTFKGIFQACKVQGAAECEFANRINITARRSSCNEWCELSGMTCVNAWREADDGGCKRGQPIGCTAENVVESSFIQRFDTLCRCKTGRTDYANAAEAALNPGNPTIPAGIELEASTSTGYCCNCTDCHAGTDDTVKVEFYIDHKWSTPQLFFDGVAEGKTMKKRFTSVENATKLRLSITGTDGWAFWRITFGGVTILKNPGGAEVASYVSGTRYWIDGESYREQNIPSSIEINIPHSTTDLFAEDQSLRYSACGPGNLCACSVIKGLAFAAGNPCGESNRICWVSMVVCEQMDLIQLPIFDAKLDVTGGKLPFVIYLDDNALTQIPAGSFDAVEPDNLVMISIQDNSLITFPKIKHGRLETLLLQNNLLTEIEWGAMRGIPLLKTLILSGNKITALPNLESSLLFYRTPGGLRPGESYFPSELTGLDLKDNPLQYVHPRMLQILSTRLEGTDGTLGMKQVRCSVVCLSQTYCPLSVVWYTLHMMCIPLSMVG
jgi:hypothetical protein